MNAHDAKVAVVGLGYVGLPLAVAFGRKVPTLGFDINEKRVADIREKRDKNNELSADEIASATYLTLSSDPADFAQYNFFVVAVPTPIDRFSVPDLTPLHNVSELVGAHLKKGDTVVYESTVYPGATEEVCVPILEKASGLRYNTDFFVGYSPERVSPADKSTIEEIVKVTSGSTPEVADYVDAVYAQVITAGTHKVSSLKAAEACKVIENSQRDVNIAFMNEVAMVLKTMGVDTQEVLGAMKTKWNALGFTPGLVGGHCIGVDPYYLIYKAYSMGVDMSILRRVRVTNDSMPAYVAEQTVLQMTRKQIPVAGARVLLMGLSFKENCPDVRNSRSADIGQHLEKFGMHVDYYDPVADAQDFHCAYRKSTITQPENGAYDAIIVTVAHTAFREMGADAIHALGKDPHVLCDVKSIFTKEDSDFRL